MLTSTYIHISGVGASTERRLWQAGAADWESFLLRPPAMRMSAARMSRMTEEVGQSRERWRAGDHLWFARALKRGEHWRAFPDFRDGTIYLDIETTGSGEFDQVTVIGLHDGREMRQYVREENLLDAEEVLAEASALVTFFGTGFDVPVLREMFPRLRFDQLHIDLCHALRRLGMRGGLKSIERQLGMDRGPDLEGLGGWDAVRLWREHQRGSEEARELLLAYNRADVENMIPLMRFAYEELRRKTLDGSAAEGSPCR